MKGRDCQGSGQKDKARQWGGFEKEGMRKKEQLESVWSACVSKGDDGRE